LAEILKLASVRLVTNGNAACSVVKCA